MSKRISQETFDEVVKENIEDFDMTKEAALNDAISQFQSQNVDLSTIDITGGIGIDELEQQWEIILNVRSNSNSTTVSEALITLGSLCVDTHPYGIRNQNLIRTKKWFNHIHSLINVNTDAIILLAALELFQILIKTNIDNRDFFEPNGSYQLCSILKYYLPSSTEKNVFVSSPTTSSVIIHEILASAFKTASIASKSENNKFMLYKEGLKDLILTAFALDCQHESSSSTTADSRYEIVRQACHAMKGLCSHDDIRKEMSCAFDNGKYFLNSGCVTLLMKYATLYKTKSQVASAALSACKQLVLTEEAVQVVAQNGGMDLPLQILQWPEAEVGLLRSTLGLMRNLCADDNRKNKLVADGTMELMVAIMSQEKCLNEGSLIENGIACLAAMSLRFPNNSLRIFNCGALDIVVKAMIRHMNRSPLIRQGCLLIRNIAARCPELRSEILDTGVENVLRAAGNDAMSSPEAYGALRDLGVEVQYVKVLEDGQIVSAYENFGEIKSNFRAIYDDQDDYRRNQLIEEHGEAPFKGQQQQVVLEEESFDHDHIHTDHCDH